MNYLTTEDGKAINKNNPLDISVAGSKAEVESAQVSMSASDVISYPLASGASEIELRVESGSIRVRADGQPCTATTGVPLGAGFLEKWNVASVSIYAVQNSVITEVSR